MCGCEHACVGVCVRACVRACVGVFVQYWVYCLQATVGWRLSTFAGNNLWYRMLFGPPSIIFLTLLQGSSVCFLIIEEKLGLANGTHCKIPNRVPGEESLLPIFPHTFRLHFLR